MIYGTKRFLSALLVLAAFQCGWSRGASPEALKGVTPRKAIEIANEWSRRGEKVVSFVTPQLVAFKFPGERSIVKIPLGGEKMYVAVAPYIKNTHT